MFAAFVTIALFGLILTLVVDVMRRDGAKIIAALEGHSWSAQPSAGRPVTIRFSRLDKAAEQRLGLPVLRAAA